MDGIKLDSCYTDSTGHFFFNLEMARDYEVHAFKENADGVANFIPVFYIKRKKTLKCIFQKIIRQQ